MELSREQRISYIRRVKDVSADIHFEQNVRSSIAHTVESEHKKYSYYYVPLNSRIVKDDSIYNFPFLFYADGSPWYEANMYMYAIASDYRKIATATDAIQDIALCLLDYLIFCEENDLNYRDFSARRAVHRPARRYFDWLVENGVSAGTINNRTAKIYYFFDWLFKQHGYENNIDLVDETRSIKIYFNSGTGSGSIDRKLRSQTVNTSSETAPVEAGFVRDEGEDLRPLTTSEREELVEILNRAEFSADERLICQLSLFAGIRKQTALTIRMKHLKLLDNKALIDKENAYLITAGPGTGIDTKFDREYKFYIPKELAEDLIVYANCEMAQRRLKKFKNNYVKEFPDLDPIADDDIYLFLSEQGNCHYMSKSDPRYKFLRKGQRPKGKRTDGLVDKIFRFASDSFPRSFVFHWLRATFALRYYENLMVTEELLVKKKLRDRPRRIDQILRDVMVRLCHKNIAVTQQYLNLFENFNEIQAAQNAYETHIFKDFAKEFPKKRV